MVIFCSKVDRAVELDRLLNLCNFPSLVIHSRLKQEERCVGMFVREIDIPRYTRGESVGGQARTQPCFFSLQASRLLGLVQLKTRRFLICVLSVSGPPSDADP